MKYFKPDLVAPGHQIMAADSSRTNGAIANSGTSMASPHVAGVIALMVSAAKRQFNIDLTAYEVYDMLRRTTSQLLPPPAVQCVDTTRFPNSAYGYGMVNAHQAIKELLRRGKRRLLFFQKHSGASRYLRPLRRL